METLQWPLDGEWVWRQRRGKGGGSVHVIENSPKHVTSVMSYTGSSVNSFYRVDWVSRKGPKDIHIFWGEDGKLVV